MSDNPKTALGILTMAAPIVLLGSLCTVCTFFYQITGVTMMHHVGMLMYPICTTKLYVQLYYGVCLRGKVTGIDPAKSCLQWTDAQRWKEIDSRNAQLAKAKAPYSYKTNTAEEVQSKWLTIKTLCMATIPISFLNLLLCLIAADVDVELPEGMPFDVTFDQLTILYSIISMLIVMVAFLITVCFGYFSDVLNKLTWTDGTCHYKSGPAYGYFIMVLGGFFALVSFYVAIVSYTRIYVMPPKDGPMGNTAFSPLSNNSVAPEPNAREIPERIEEGNEEEDDDEDENDEHNSDNGKGSKDSDSTRLVSPISARPLGTHSPIPLTPPTRHRPRSAGSVAPAPTDDYSAVVMG